MNLNDLPPHHLIPILLVCYGLMSFVARGILFCLHAILIYFKSRVLNFEVSGVHLERYPGADLGHGEMLFIWPFALVIMGISMIGDIINYTWRAVFTTEGSKIRLIPKWFSIDGLARMMNGHKKEK